MSQKGGYRTALLNRGENRKLAVGQNLMEFMTGIIGFYFLAQGAPASLLLISTLITTTSLSKTLGHSWASLPSHVNVNGTEIEKKVCPETFYVRNDKTDAKSRCSVASQLPCTISGHQTPAPHSETTVGRNGRAKQFVLSIKDWAVTAREKRGSV